MMTNRKFKLTEEKVFYMDKILYRISALKDFCDVKAGDRGGFIEKEENLSHEGNCWIYDNAFVYGDAGIYDDVKIRDISRVHGNAVLCGDSVIQGRSEIRDDVKIWTEAKRTANLIRDVELYGNTCAL